MKAIVSLKPALKVDPMELIAFCRERMAVYKSSRLIEIVPDLPKTPTGKIMRRALREAGSPIAAPPVTNVGRVNTVR